MKISMTKVLGGAVLALGLMAGIPQSSVISVGSGEARAAADVSINLGTFYDRLAPYGDWIRRGNVYVFVPAVSADWRPYTYGHWEYTDRFGWIWLSEEPFGWATYHYGRWGYDDEIGWYWVPATEWAPAWVSWRRSDNYIGWAPLPPDPDTGLSVNIDLNSDRYADRYWAVVPAPQFLAGNLRTVVIRRGDTRFKGVFHATQALGRVNVVNKVVVNNIIKVTDVERVTRQKVRIKQVREVGDVGHAGKAGAGDTVDVFAPKVEKTANDKPKAVKPVEEVARKRKNKSAGEANQPGQGTNVLPDKSGQTSTSGQTQQGIVTQKKKTNEPGQGQAKGSKQLEQQNTQGQEGAGGAASTNKKKKNQLLQQNEQNGGNQPQIMKKKQLEQQNTLGQEGTAGAPSNNKKKNQLLQQNEQNGGNQPQIMKKKQLQQQNTQGQEGTGGAASNKKKNQLLQQNEQGQQLGGQNQNQNQNQNKKAKKNCVPGTENCPG